ncbi:hypothetical protein ACNKHT_10330 [Shigella flexneri]
MMATIEIPLYRQRWWFGKQDDLLSGNQSVTNAGETAESPVETMCTLGTGGAGFVSYCVRNRWTLAETNLKTVKTGFREYYDELPTEGNEHGQVFRHVELEKELLIEAQILSVWVRSLVVKTSLTHTRDSPHLVTAHPVRLVWVFSRLADRNIKAKDGTVRGSAFKNWNIIQGTYPEELRKAGEGEAACVDLNRPMKEIPRTVVARSRFYTLIA